MPYHDQEFSVPRLMPYLAVAIALVVAPRPSQGQAPRRDAAADRAAVHRAVLDYVEAFYEGDSTKLVRAVRPEFSKFGFDWVRDSSRYIGQPMTWPAALSFVRRVRERKRFAPPTAPKEVAVLDVADQTAAAKLTAYWGIDYLLLARYGDHWMISHVLWQTPPPK